MSNFKSFREMERALGTERALELEQEMAEYFTTAYDEQEVA